MWLSAKNAAAYRKSIKTFKTPNFLDIKKLQTFRQVGSRCQFHHTNTRRSKLSEHTKKASKVFFKL